MSEGGLLGGESLTVTCLRPSAPQISATHYLVWNKIDSSYMVSKRPFCGPVNISPSGENKRTIGWPKVN